MPEKTNQENTLNSEIFSKKFMRVQDIVKALMKEPRKIRRAYAKHLGCSWEVYKEMERIASE